jgi:tetratricopeptide (TPR) repeat protein
VRNVLTMYKFLVVLFSVLSFSTEVLASPQIDSVEKELHLLLNRKSQFESKKIESISRFKDALKTTKNLRDKYVLHLNLYHEFKKYQIDSAIFYIKANQLIGHELNNPYLIDESLIQLASLYSSAGKFIESADLLSQIRRAQMSEDLLPDYYKAYSEFSSHYGQSSNNDLYFRDSEIFRDSLLSVLNPQSIEYQITFATKKLYNNEMTVAEKLLHQLLQETDETRSERGLIAYLLGIIYKNKGELDKQIYFFGLSALTDIKHAVKDNASLQSLALCYYEKGDVDKAYLYIQEAINDAIFCNVRYRTIESSSFYPIINASFQEKENRQKNELKSYLMVISLMTIVLSVVLGVLFIQIKKLKKIRIALKQANDDLHHLNDQLLKVNNELSESNHIKEEYIAHFFDICSSYIDKMDNARKTILKKLSNKQESDILKHLKSQDVIKEELEDLYRNFDIIFLNLYPSFIDEFNKLLKPEEQILPKSEELLSTELRIFALIRLGISDSTKIASFLRYSLRTVYNYRVKVRNKVLGSKDEFEDKIKKIGEIQF